MYPQLYTLILFGVVTAFTPGPNNTMLTVSGIKFGFLKTVPHLFGIPTGHAIQLTLVCFGLGIVFEKYPIIHELLKYIGTIYLIFYTMIHPLNKYKLS